MSDTEKAPEEKPVDPTTPPTGLGILFLAAALALAFVLALVALVAYMAFSPAKIVNPPSAAPAKPAHEGHLLVDEAALDRRT
ncbi:MAG: hypothetical protein ABJE95_38585 [Byssovorax sp.]